MSGWNISCFQCCSHLTCALKYLYICRAAYRCSLNWWFLSYVIWQYTSPLLFSISVFGQNYSTHLKWLRLFFSVVNSTYVIGAWVTSLLHLCGEALTDRHVVGLDLFMGFGSFILGWLLRSTQENWGRTALCLCLHFEWWLKNEL